MSSQLMIEKIENIYQIEEDDIKFKINRNYINNLLSSNLFQNINLISSSQIEIKNLCQEYISLRVKTTKKQNYIVEPPYFILNPSETKTINIYFYINKVEEINEKGHKFKFEGFVIKESEKNKNIKNIFADYIKSGTKVRGNVVKKYVKFIDDNNYEIPNKSIIQKRYSVSESSSDLSIEENLKELTSHLSDNNLRKEESSLSEDKKDNFKFNKNEENLRDEEELENLKIEYYKLKNNIDNLKMTYINLEKRLELEQNKIKQENIYRRQFSYQLPENKRKPFSKIILFYLFIGSAFIGFYLTK
jgi:hypothetical protein